MNIASILARKGPMAVTVRPDQSIRDALALLDVRRREDAPLRLGPGRVRDVGRARVGARPRHVAGAELVEERAALLVRAPAPGAVRQAHLDVVLGEAQLG